MQNHVTSLLVVLLLLCGCIGIQSLDSAPIPLFTQSVYNATIYENSAAKTYLESPVKMGIYITDPTWEIRYKIVLGDNENLFKAEDFQLGDFSFLRIRTKGGSSAILNREVRDHYILTVKAMEKNSNAEARTQVRIQVLDTNDLRPLFSPTAYSISIPENTAIRTSVAKVMATDADIGTNGEYYYSFREWTEMFSVHPTSGVVALTGKLDYSETKQYELEILAVDRGMKLYGSSGFSSMAKLTVRVEQANEHAPVITAVTLAPSDTDKDPTYAVVTVEDNDQGANGEIASLSVVAGDPLQQFKAMRTSPGSKEYKIHAVKQVDWDSQPFGYNLTLQAKDKGSPPQFSSAKVIHVTSPHFKVGPSKFSQAIYRVNVSEFAPLHTPVVMVTAVPKYPQLKYAFRHKLDKNHFAINADSGLITTAGPLHADSVNKYELEVMTSDKKAAAKVIINVIDVNNNAPEFKQTSYKASIDENMPIGTSVLTVKATDLDSGENGYVTYSIANVNPQPFVIDYFSGVISSSEILDYELMPRIYTLQLRASDWGSPFRREVETQVTVTLNNLNDNKPLFENVDCDITVPRDLGLGEQITTVSAIDADELQLVRYRMKAGNDLNLFEMNPNSGILSLKQPLSEGEAAKVSYHSLQIIASDGEQETQPMFLNITVVTAHKPVQVKCVDTGVASMLAEKLLQGSKIHSQSEPEDHFQDFHSVNRVAPQFAETFPSVIEVKEDLPVGARIVHLSATDSDSGFNGKLVYVISGGDAESRFVLDMDSGWLKVYTPLDRETTDHYTLNITVYDLGIPQKSSSRLLDVKILDANDNSPQFLQDTYSVEISEGTAVGTEIIQVEAKDKDLGDNGVVRYSILADTDQFSIDTETGIVTVKKPLDHEVQPSFVLKIAARDQAAAEPQLVSTVLLKITLEDVNDNPPKFVPPNYQVRVREDLPIGTVIMWLEAHDPDVGPSSQVRYSLIDNGDGKFEVDKLSGAVRIVQNLDYEKKQVYSLTARVKDKGKPISLSSSCHIEVEVVDVNENLYRPLFPSFVDKGFIKEDVPIGTSVMKITAQDEDKGRDGEISYSIRDGSGLGIFTIDEETGVIRTQELLDHETVPHYWVTVYATDRGVVPLSSFVEVYIEVQDVNDNAPQTSEPVYYPSVMENSPKDVSIIQIEAFDPDTKSSEKLSYKITSGNPQGFFSINPKTGLVTTTSRKLDREQQDEHILEITVSDQGVPVKSATVRVIVKVLDENDNKPQFMEKVYKIKLPEREKPEKERALRRDPVYRVIASDRDEGPNAEISYSIEDGDEQGKFFIEPKTGMVSFKKFSSAGDYDILTIKAVDNGRPQKSSTCRLHIEWIPKPEPSELPLAFDEPFYSFSVMESDPVAHMVGVITTESVDTPVWFEITGGNSDSRFEVGKASGTVIVAQALDAEQKSHYNLTVDATDGTRSVSTQVLIKVIDTNNHRPQFSKSKYEVNVPEDTSPDTEVLQITASDQDEKNKLTYTLLSSTDPFSLRKFRLDPGTGVLYTAEKLDHETMHQHTLTVMVRDQDIPVKRNLVRVIVNVQDTNDNAPWFNGSPYVARVFESAAIGSAVLQVSALDKDKGQNAEIIYNIESVFDASLSYSFLGNVGNSFAIDPILGTITVAKELDRSNKNRFELTVKASDKGTPPLSATGSVEITVTISDNAIPKFAGKEFSAEVSETALPGAFVSLVTANSQSSVFYQIKDGNVNGKFKVDPVTGVITIQNVTQLRSRYELRVRVSDGRFSKTALVKINVRENKESTLRFTQESYKAFVPENSLEKKTLAVIAAVGNQVNEPLFYTILNPDKRFTISRTSGVLSSTGTPFDREEQAVFDIVVEVIREDKSSDVAHVLVTVIIEDVNDNPPVFVNLPYQALVLVDTEVGHIITKVTAVDADIDRNAEISYHIQELNEFVQISMDGEISLTKKLEKDSLNTEFVITAVARDGGEPALSSSVDVTIMVVNKAMPVFEKAFYSLEIPENIPLLMPVVHIQANDSEGPRIVYTITEGDPLNQFSINFNTGVIQVVKPLDFETHPAYKLSVRATDSLTGAKAEVFVDVILEDVNDNPPVFHTKSYNASLSEASVIGTSVLQVSATDADTGNNQVLFYQIVEDKDKSSDYFSIDRDTGTIWTTQMLDHEENPSHKLMIRAVDGGVPALSSEVMVLIDVTDLNDNTPVFSQNVYEATVSELAPRGHFVTQVQASDADNSDSGKLEFSIISGNEGQNFAIDPNTGAIVISNHRKPHMESLYNINVSVSDGVFRSSAIVKVNVISANFHNPTFNQVDYVVELLENSPVGTLVAEAQATDEDSGTYGRLTYHIVNDIAKDKFSISEDGEIFTLESLDRENPLEKVIPISLIAKDGGGKVGFCTVNVILTDINDNVPQFRAADYRVNVASDMPRGTTILKIAASDMDEGSNADITYSIEGDADNVEENFEIHQFSGVIVTKESLIGLENQLYTFLVRAKDGGNPTMSSVVPVYVRILAPEVPVPKFIESHYRFAIDEDLPLSSEVDVIQAESDQPVFYSLVKGNTPESNQDEVFVVDPTSGSLKLEKKLDHESTKWYLLTLQAQSEYDGNKVVSSVDISIQVKDVNDNPPLFESNPYEAFIVENLPGGTSVIQVKATDLDSGTNGHMIYNLDSNQAARDIAELFAINSETGWITTLKELDREKKSKYTVSVLATDRGDKVQLMAKTKVDVTVVDVNDNPPRFTAEIYKGTVSEDDPPGGVIAILSTTDLDTEDNNKQINYFITGGDPLGQFGIEHTQGEWKVSVRKPLDREEKDNYLLNITATDGTFTAKAVVEVKVLDANDNSPICEKSFYMESVPEDSPAGRLILQVSATDDDIRSNAQISYELLGPGSEHFSIDSETGELKTLLPLDREEKEVHKMKVRALDGGGRFCEAEVEITVEDVNDNAPQFTSDPYTFTVFENTEINTPVACLHASDLDTGSNAEILYSLLDSADGVFSIDEETGIVHLDRPLDRELQSLYTLRASATDRGSPQRLSSITTVSVSILDINDNPPVFERREYTATVAEDILVGTQVLRVHAASRDTEAGAEITYAIINGNERGAFRVDPHTGGVFVIEPLDYETAHEYYLTVEATDGGTPPLSDMATVNINLTDVNDNSPVFSQDIYSAVISEDAELGKAVLTVMADDADGPSSNQVRFSIIDGNQGSLFTIDPIRGEVKVARQLDREKTSGYTLTVMASDNGSPARSSSSTVNIDVSDINDNSPLFSQANYSIIIQENQPIGTSVLQLTVSDRDASHNGPPFTFSIISGNEGEAFQITPQGVLVSAATLSRQTQEFYLLQAQVTDSGRPPLVSTAFVSVRLIEESIYPPVILPLDIFITTATDEYSGGVLGKIHATDQDVYDTLTYSLAPDSSSTSENSGLFSVSPADGKLVARGNLDAGQYVLNITVTDGRFTAAARVNIHVRQATAQALDNSIAVRFSAIAPEEFIGDYWRNFLRALRNIAGVRRGDVQLVSLQPAADASGDLEVLLALERSGSPFQPQEVVYRKLNASVGVIEEMTGVRIVRVMKKLCAGLDCPLSYCQETVSLETGAVSAYSTARISFVTPRHMRTSKCLCEGAECPVLSKLCEGSPCPDGMECVEDPMHTKFKCICPEGKQEECSERQSLTFSGNGYARYRLMENENKEEMKLFLRLRTFSTHATVMYAKGTDYSILEIVNGRLQYKFDCGSGPGVVSVHSTQVSDGQWHSVSLEVDGNYARLVLDQVHAASGTAPGTLRTLNLDTSMYFGGHARPAAGSGRLVVNGLRGCLEGIVFNGRELPLSQVRGVHSVLEELVEAAPGCSLTPPVQGCSSNPCTNGGTCSSLPNGGYFCKCTAAFMGTHCEVTISPCASNPCLYGGTCIPRGGDFYCQCRGQYSGQRQILFCSLIIKELCEIFRCLSDVDECLKNPCGNGGHCQNTYGSFNCNCSAGYSGRHCELLSEIRNEFVSTTWNIGLEEVIGIVVFVASIFFIVLLFVVVRKRICRRSKSKSDDDDKFGVSTGAPHAFLQRPYFDSKLNKNIYSDIPPQVPVRPISYTPSIPSDSRNNLDRNSFEGSAIPEHPEFSTFNPDSVHVHRKTVAVCSVAPNLPPPPPSNSVSDSDSIQKPSWDYDYDAKVVDLDPCLSKKPVEDSACHPYNTRGSMSEVHSLSSFQSESCDDNGYHWDTSDWMPSVQLPGIQEFPQYEVVKAPPTIYSDPALLDTDYYPGGYDIESDFPPPHDDFPSHDDLPPPPPVPEYGDRYDTLQPTTRALNSAPSSPGGSGVRQRPPIPQLYSLTQFLPHHHYSSDPEPQTNPTSTITSSSTGGYRHRGFPLGYGRDFDLPTADNMSLSLYTSTASCSDMSACCEESEVMMSDYESGGEEEGARFQRLIIPLLDSQQQQQHTEV
uniref:FAT atypical cadherin 1a n=1 Tax=Cyprinus carpio TaxID=7962 RepID=A0A8C2CXI1_CYPCA